MTEREFLTGLNTEEMNDAQKAYIKDRIAKLDERNEKRKNTPTKTQKENEGIETAILEALAGGAKLSTELATALNLTSQKVNGVAGNLAKEGKVTAEKVKIKGVGERTRYALVEAVTDEAEEAEEEGEKEG